MELNTKFGMLLLLSALVYPLQSHAHPPWMTGDYSDTDQDWGMMGSGMRAGMMGGMMEGMMEGGCAMGMPGHGFGMGGMRGALMGIYALDLSEQQQKQINEIQDKLRKDNWQIAGKILDARAKLRDAWSADKPDPKAVGAAFEEISKLQREALENRVKALNKLYDLLTDEQRNQLKSSEWGPGRHMGVNPGRYGGRMMMH